VELGPVEGEGEFLEKAISIPSPVKKRRSTGTEKLRREEGKAAMRDFHHSSFRKAEFLVGRGRGVQNYHWIRGKHPEVSRLLNREASEFRSENSRKRGGKGPQKGVRLRKKAVSLQTSPVGNQGKRRRKFCRKVKTWGWAPESWKGKVCLPKTRNSGC